MRTGFGGFKKMTITSFGTGLRISAPKNGACKSLTRRCGNHSPTSEITFLVGWISSSWSKPQYLLILPPISWFNFPLLLGLTVSSLLNCVASNFQHFLFYRFPNPNNQPPIRSVELLQHPPKISNSRISRGLPLKSNRFIWFAFGILLGIGYPKPQDFLMISRLKLPYKVLWYPMHGSIISKFGYIQSNDLLFDICSSHSAICLGANKMGPQGQQLAHRSCRSFVMRSWRPRSNAKLQRFPARICFFWLTGFIRPGLKHHELGYNMIYPLVN